MKLMYVTICTRPNIAQILGVVSILMENLGKEHWSAIKRTLIYIKGTLGVALCFGRLKLVVKDYVYQPDDQDRLGKFDNSNGSGGSNDPDGSGRVDDPHDFGQPHT